jgi:hypothetical protein
VRLMSMQDVIDIVSKKLEGSGYIDYEIEEAVKEAEFQIRNFTGRWQRKNIVDLYGTVTASEVEPLPDELNYIWASLAMETIQLTPSAYARSQSVGGIVVDSSRVVKTIKEGDVSIEFEAAASGDASSSKSSSGSASGAVLIGSYAEQLYPFRRLYPSVGDAYANR